MRNEQIKAWVTKYALTSGIQAVTGEVSEKYPTMLAYSGNYAHGNDWHRTPEAAIARAEQMRKAKIESLKKSIQKLEAMTLEAPAHDN